MQQNDINKANQALGGTECEDKETLAKLNFLMNYCEAENAATGSKYDANANVEKKNIATLIGELPKQGFIRLNRMMLTNRITEMYGKELADKYLSLLNQHFIYKNDETSLANYCASITMYPWLIGGTKDIGGNSTPPTNLKSFCGGFVNMVFIVSSMLSGACATPEFLMYMNYFLQKEYGEDYYKRADEVVDLSIRRRNIDKVITDCFEQVVYSINQPTGARNFQAVFWNISYYDRYYFNSLFENFYFPDGSRPDWNGLNWLQKRFMKWFNQERLRTPLTFPVETMALLADENGDIKDKEYADFTAEMYAEGHSFFTYVSDNADSLSSCCFDGNEKVMYSEDNDISHLKSDTFANIYKNHKGKKIYAISADPNGEVWTSLAECEVVAAKSNKEVVLTASGSHGEEIKVISTADHMYPVFSKPYDEYYFQGDKRADALQEGDILMVSTDAFDGVIPFGRVISVDVRDCEERDFYCFKMADESKPYFLLSNHILTHNCRLRNEITDNGFSYTLGAGGISTGSKSVLTINLNRAIQYAVNNGIKYQDYIEEIVDLMHKVQIAYNENLKALQAKGMLPLFDAGYINIGRQYLTIGVNGLVEGAEFLGIEISDNPQYAAYVQEVLGIVEKLNKAYRTKDMMFNCEMIPAENVGVKHAKWDREDGYVVPRDCYNSYFYVVEDQKVNIIDKFKMHGRKYIEHLTGGSALHCNLDEHLSKDQYRQLLRVAAQEGCNYFTFNIPNTVCNECGHIDKRHLHKCPKCGSENLDYLTRIIGYLKRVSNFSAPRKAEAAQRYYANMKDNNNEAMFSVRESRTNAPNEQ